MLVLIFLLLLQRMKRSKKLLPLLWLLLLSNITLAQTHGFGQYNSVNLELASGLPNNFVNDIFEDSKGFIWISTNGGGLVRYDGYSYLNMGIGSRSPQLKSNSCRNVVEDGHERLWVSLDECTEIIDLKKMTSTFPLCKTEKIKKTVTALFKEPSLKVFTDSKKNVWLVTRKHISHLVFDKVGNVISVLQRAFVSNTLEVAIDDIRGDGSVLVAYGGNLHEIHDNGTALVDRIWLKKDSPLYGLIVYDMLVYRQRLYLATNNGLHCLNTGNMAYVYMGLASSLSHPVATCLAFSPDGRLMVGTLNGVDILSDNTGMFEHFNVANSNFMLRSNFIRCFYVNHGQIWIGTETGGVTELVPRLLRLENYVHSSRHGSLSPNSVNAMYYDEPCRKLWVGTVEGGLNSISDAELDKPNGGGDFVHYTTSNSALSHNSVSALTVDDQRQLWIATWGGGVCVATHLEGTLAIRPLEVGTSFQPLMLFIGALAYDRKNHGMWIGSNEGVFFYDYITKQLLNPFKGNRNIRGCIGSIITRDGHLMMGCLEGYIDVDLNSRKGDKGTFKMMQQRFKMDNPESGVIEKIVCFCEAPDGTLWLGSRNYGLYRRTRTGNGKYIYKVYTTRHGLQNNSVKGIASDSNGMLWITTDYGLSLMNPNTDQITNYGERDGLVNSQFYFNSLVREGHGDRFFLGGVSGLTVLYGLQHTPTHTGNLCFTQLQVDNQEVDAQSSYLKEDISRARCIRLHQSDKSFTLFFSVLNYGSEGDGTYCYRMLGFENSWISLPHGEHGVRYTRLSPGDYTFQVKYVSPLSQETDEKIISIDIKVVPYFWNSWWFLLLLIVLVLAMAYYIYKRHLEKLRNRETENLYRPIEKALSESDDPKDLQLRIKNILDNQKRYYVSQAKILEADKVQMEQQERSFLDRIIKVLEENYSKSEFGVNELCEMLGVSRSVVSKKLKEESGVSTSQFIRNYRLDAAKEIILKNPSNRNITEIAYQVGFNDPKYFTRCFTKQYGTSPSAFKGE